MGKPEQDDDQDEDLVKIAEAAEILGVQQQTLRRWADRGKIPAVIKMSGHRLFARAELMKAKAKAERARAQKAQKLAKKTRRAKT